jgi:hypothetical protein
LILDVCLISIGFGRFPAGSRVWLALATLDPVAPLKHSLLGSKYLAHGKRCAEGIVRVLSFDFAFWQGQNPHNFHIG